MISVDLCVFSVDLCVIPRPRLGCYTEVHRVKKEFHRELVPFFKVLQIKIQHLASSIQHQ